MYPYLSLLSLCRPNAGHVIRLVLWHLHTYKTVSIWQPADLRSVVCPEIGAAHWQPPPSHFNWVVGMEELCVALPL